MRQKASMRLVSCWLVLLLPLALACSPAPEPPSVEKRDAGSHEAVLPPFQEAPELAARVAAGELPPVAERLPTNPLLVEPEERIGEYGGTLEVLTIDRGIMSRRVVGYENLLRWDLHWQRVLPNVAQAVEASDDATTYTFHLRPGLRWSDGEPFTADDILFWYESVLLDPRLTRRPMSWLTSSGEPVLVEKGEPHTVVFRFAEPNSFFLPYMAGVLGSGPTRYPRHYLAPFHPGPADPSAPDEDWVARFKEKANPEANPDLPTLEAWTRTTADTELTTVRNPYYWKIDTAYQQLPYLDRVVFNRIESPEDVDRHLGDGQAHFVPAYELGDLELSPESQRQLQRVSLTSSNSSAIVIGLNLNHQDPRLRSFFQSKDFRIGLSHAIDRQRFVDEIQGGKGEPYQAAPRPESRFYHQQLARQFTEYDRQLANRHLDLAGCSARDSEGFRLGPDGKRISFWLEVREADPRYAIQVAEDSRHKGTAAHPALAIDGDDRRAGST